MTGLWPPYFTALAVLLSMGVLTWLYSLKSNDVSSVDSLWSLMFLAAAITYAGTADVIQPAAILLLALVATWSLRLSLFLMLRNWGQPEDRRYQEIRQNNEPNFRFKSLYIIFGLQGVLAWIISVPLLLALTDPALSFNWLTMLACLLWLAGFLVETIADNQLYHFKSNSDNRGKVLRSGLWKYSRHPNYFGECLVWWAFYLFALSVGAWWTIFSPLLMTLLLLKVSGVSLMEKDITERRPQYRDYVENTSAFIPWKPRNSKIYIHRGHES